MTESEKLQKKRREKAAKLSNPTPVELPSGAWRCQVMYKGKRYSVVDDDPEIAHTKALAYKAGIIKEDKHPENMTVGEAIDRYIESKDSVLSPSTIGGYRKIRKTNMQDLMTVQLRELTQERVQKSVNKMVKDGLSPKSIRNAHGLLTATLAAYYPDMILRTTLPQKSHHEVSIPSDREIGDIMTAVKGTRAELPVLLALCLGLRLSEIRGLQWDCISGNQIHIKQALVDTAEGPVLKLTKTYSGDRTLTAPQYIIDLIKKQGKDNPFVIPQNGRAIYWDFTHACQKTGIPHYRFHDLRHANASVMLALGVPDKYAMERMGHASNNMLKTVYQHTMKDKQEEVSEIVDNYFTKKIESA